ncbi:hypothetical protein M514_28255, partial [Olea europaea subsp. europaea]
MGAVLIGSWEVDLEVVTQDVQLALKMFNEEKLRLALNNPLQERNWDAVLPLAVPSINTSYHSSIGCIPYEMTFGGRPPLQDKQLTEKANPYDLYAKLVRSYMRECHSQAISIQSASQERSR